MYEKIKNLWSNGEFQKAYSLTQDEKLNDLINMINKQGGIDYVPPYTVYSIVIENEYLLNLLCQ